MDGLQSKQLLVPRCVDCDVQFFPPGPVCPDCLGEEIEFVEHPGRGRIYAFTAMDNPFSGGESMTLAMIELQGVEGRIFARVDAPYEKLAVGMEVSMDYWEREGILLPCYLVD
jgi:uncharacterized OB-fold protein